MKEQGILGYREKMSDGSLIHRITRELFLGTYNEAWKNDLKGFSMQLRRKVNQNEIELFCDCCGGRLSVAGNYYDSDDERPFGAKRLHLKHRKGEQGSECVYAVEESKSKKEINHDNYVNKRESPLHFRLKAFVSTWIQRCLPECECVVEKRIQVGKTHRKPDINVKFVSDGLLKAGSNIAIEIQVSPIMMSDIDRRMEIDREGQRYILWILDHYDGTVVDVDSLYKEDLFERCGLNIFVIDEETLRATDSEGMLMLKVYYTKYHLDGEVLAKPEMICEMIPFTALKFQEKKYRVYYYQSEAERESCLNEADELRKKREAKEKEEAEAIERKLKEERIREQVMLKEKKLYDSFLYSVSNSRAWEGNIQEVIGIIRKDCRSKFNCFIEALTQNQLFDYTDWNLLVDCLTVLSVVYPDYLATYEDYSFEYDETVSSLRKKLILYLADRAPVKNPHQFSMGHVIDSFPYLLECSLGILSNPNYQLNEEDVRIAQKHIKKYNVDLSQGFTPDSNQKNGYAKWCAFVLADRILKSKTNFNKRDLLELMIKKWSAVCVFLSMSQGHIVGFGYKHWVDFADYMKRQYPELVPKFLTVAQKKSYPLKSNKKDHFYVLSMFIREHQLPVSPELEELFKIIFPNL